MSTILYKFKSSTNFENISLPGTSARLFDVKRAIVKANKLDRSTGGGMQLEFDISVKNAMTDEAYDDENMLLPRGTRIIIQRLPAARGQGLLARIARADAGMASGKTASYGNVAAADNGFYTIQSAREDDDEFIDATPNFSTATQMPEPTNAQDSEEKELEALKAVTDQAGSMYRPNTSLSRPSQPSKFAPAGSAPATYKPPAHASFHSHAARPNADPELRKQEQLMAQQAQTTVKRRATGIPRTFLNIPPPAVATEGDEDGFSEGIKLQPNDIGFQALVNRGGGQSGSGAGKRRDLDYALKLTATEIPEHLQCGICAQVVKNAMLIPWDGEGRTACEMCMRDGLAKSGFRCPLTGQDGVSPDDLIVNMGLRKAVDMFVKEVMEKMDQIIEKQEADEEEEREKQAKIAMVNKKSSEYDGDSLDKGMVVNRKGAGSSKGRRQSDDFGEDEFGGDVFDVEEEEEEEEEDIVEESSAMKTKSEESSNQLSPDDINTNVNTEKKESFAAKETENFTEKEMNNVVATQNNANSTNNDATKTTNDKRNDTRAKDPSTPIKTDDDSVSTVSRRELLRNRAPPAGYSMGPAGSVGVDRHSSPVSNNYGGRVGGYNNQYNQGGRGNFRGVGGRGRFSRHQNHYGQGRGFNGAPPGRGYQTQVSSKCFPYSCDDKNEGSSPFKAMNWIYLQG